MEEDKQRQCLKLLGAHVGVPHLFVTCIYFKYILYITETIYIDITTLSLTLEMILRWAMSSDLQHTLFL